MDHSVYVVEGGDDTASRSRDSKPKIECYPDSFLVVFIELASWRGLPKSEYFFAVIAHPRSDVERISWARRYVVGCRSGARTQRQPVFVDVIDIMQEPEGRTYLIPGVIWLYRLDDVLRRSWQIPDFRSALFSEALASFLSLRIKAGELFLVDGKFSPFAWGGGSEKCQLPSEVIEARAKIMRDIACHYAQTNWRVVSDIQPPNVIAALRVYLMPGRERGRL